jgi:molecular chaperone DnaK (HSP70)
MAKEGIRPNSKRVVLELGALGADAPAEPVLVAVADYYDRIRPLVTRSLDALAPVLGEGSFAAASNPTASSATVDAAEPHAIPEDALAGIYVVGGASGLPLVPRMLRERFGRRVHRSPHPAAATAIGLTILASLDEPPAIAERFTRHLGVFRERDDGSRVSFDGIFPKGTPMPDSGSGPLVAVRTYRAAHNVGHFRFVECSALDAEGDPRGDITWHAELKFPFAAELRQDPKLDGVPIERLAAMGPPIEERYEVDAAGVIAATITDLSNGYSRRYVL